VSAFAKHTVQEAVEQGSLVSDVLHKLSQPLTALQCSLELSLARDQTSEEFRASVDAALQNADRLRQSLLLLRELSDADDPGDVSVPVRVQELLQELREDFLPVFESAGGRFDLNCDAVQVRANGIKLRRALFYLLEYVVRSSRYRKLSVDVKQTQGRLAEIRMTFSSAAPSTGSRRDASEPASAGEVEIARRTFRAVGGNLRSVESPCGQSLWIASLLLDE
jgi:signal transduction histidine kinase